MTYTTSVLEIDYHASQWRIARFTPHLCQKLLGNASQYNDFVQYQVQTKKHSSHTPTYKRDEEGLLIHQQYGTWVLILP